MTDRDMILARRALFVSAALASIAPDAAVADLSTETGEVHGSVVRKKAGEWSSVELPEGTSELLGVWGSSSRDLWFVGGQSLLRYRE